MTMTAFASSLLTIDIPGAQVVGSEAHGINNRGDIIGRYNTPGVLHGFLLRHGDLSTITNNAAGFGINDRGDIVGVFFSGGSRGFLLRDGNVTAIAGPNTVASDNTEVTGINNRGDIVGVYSHARVSHGFMLRDDTFIPVEVPGTNCDQCFTEPLGINDAGDIVGAYSKHEPVPGSCCPSYKVYGFVLHQGEFTTIDVPGGRDTRAYGISDTGDIAVTTYGDAFGYHAYVFHDGALDQITFPEAASVQVFGINDRRDVVGSYFDHFGVEHAYVLTR